MRSLPSASIAALILVASFAAAGGTYKHDATGDVRVTGPLALVAPSCTHDAIDITTGWAYDHDGSLYVGVGVVDPDAEGRCGDEVAPHTELLWAVSLEEDIGAGTPLLDDRRHTVSFFLVQTPSVTGGCVVVRLPIGAESGCIPSFQRWSNNMTWTLPVTGTFEDAEGDEYAYDLTGLAFRTSFEAVAYDPGLLGLTTLRDDLAGATWTVGSDEWV